MTKEQIREYTVRTTSANHSGLILVLTDISTTYINDSIVCYDDFNMAGFKRNVELAKKAVNELIDCFNLSNKQAREVVSLLRYIYGSLVASSIKQELYNMDQCVSILDRLRVSFEKLQEIDQEEPVMKNTHQVYAGLTYGKGTLNESVEGVDITRRGFYA